MKIVQLDIQGFRSLKNVSWRPGDLNVVIGPNGSGKSNLLRMLELISAAADGKLQHYVDASGGISQMLWDGQTNWLQFSLTTFENEPTGTTEELTYEVVLRAFSDLSEYRVDSENLRGKDNFSFIVRSKGRGRIHTRIKGSVMSEAATSAMAIEETLLSGTGSPFLGGIVESGLPSYRSQSANWSIYQEMRTDQNASLRQAPVSRLEQRVSTDGQNLINVLHTFYTSARKFKQDINDGMHAAFGADFDELIFGPAGDQRIQMRIRWKTLKRDQSTADLSDGTLRFLFLLTVLATPNPPPLIAIDEPETGLHPSMLPIIAEYAVEAATRTQVIFTTHSDQFLSAFQDTRPTVTVAKWENGETGLTTLSDEELSYWLKDYSLGKLFRSGELENMAA